MINIEAIDGTVVSVRPERVLFFWQKLVVPKGFDPCDFDSSLETVTQVVYTTKDHDEDTERSGREQLLYVHVTPLQRGISSSFHGKPSRGAVDTLFSLDRMQELMRAALPEVRFCTLHRAYTSRDDRVIFPLPSYVQSFEVVSMWPEGVPDTAVEGSRYHLCNEGARAGGGGMVARHPLSHMPTVGHVAIQLYEDALQIHRMLQPLFAEHGIDAIVRRRLEATEPEAPNV